MQSDFYEEARDNDAFLAGKSLVKDRKRLGEMRHVVWRHVHFSKHVYSRIIESHSIYEICNYKQASKSSILLARDKYIFLERKKLQRKYI